MDGALASHHWKGSARHKCDPERLGRSKVSHRTDILDRCLTNPVAKGKKLMRQLVLIAALVVLLLVPLNAALAGHGHAYGHGRGHGHAYGHERGRHGPVYVIPTPSPFPCPPRCPAP